MQYASRLIKWILPCVAIIFSVLTLIFSLGNKYTVIGTSDLLAMVDALTEGYKLHQIVASVLLFVAGYMIAQAIFERQSDIMKAVWAVPISIIVWCIFSAAVLLLRIPYTKVSMLIVTALGLCIFFYIRRNYMKQINWAVFCRYSLWCTATAIFISTGILKTFMSSDSNYYVMQYGEIIAKTGSLSFDTAGAFMTWTGMSSALISSLAYFCGFETIVVIHYLLVFSLLGAFYLFCKKQFANWSKDCKSITLWALLCTLVLVVIPAFQWLAWWVISNTYCMVFIFFLMLGLHMYTYEERTNKALLILLSAMICWLTLSRAETCVCMACMLFIASILPFTKKEMLCLTVPMTVCQLLFLIELDIQQALSTREVADSMLTTQIQIIMIVAMVGCVIYSFLIDYKPCLWLRSRVQFIVVGLLPLLCLAIYFLDKEKYITSIKSTIHNLMSAYWGIASIIIVILLIIIFDRKKLNYWVTFSTGYVLVNFALCLGRKQPLREGVGDSCNRILMSAVPIVLYAIIVTIGERLATNATSNIADMECSRDDEREKR